MKKYIAGMVALLGLVAAESALADGNKKHSQFDANRDGVISQSERENMMREHMQYADANGDGKVSNDEWTIYESSRHDQYAAAYQRRDGNYTISQYRNLPTKVMYEDRLDKYAPAAGKPNRDSSYYRDRN